MSQYDLIGNQLSVILKEKIANLPVKEVAEVFVEKTKDDTLSGNQPSGIPFPKYAKDTNKSGVVTMRDYQKGIESVSTLYDDAVSATIGFTGNSGLPNSKADKPTSEVMLLHQEGKARGNKIRRVFLDEQDVNSAGYNASIEQVEQILEEYFNE